MKRLFFLLFLLVQLATSAFGVPVLQGLWKTLTLPDGTTVEAQLTGDEHAHYWLAADGTAYIGIPGTNDSIFKPVNLRVLSERALSRQQSANMTRQKRIRRKAIGDFTHYSGKKKGLVILVEFPDQKFQTNHNKVLYQRICNEEGFVSSEGFVGSVYDYFKAQSYGSFELTFDVIGPITVSKSYRYYGENDEMGYDMYPGELTAAACKVVDSQVDFADYDWDGDNLVDQVMIIYAGRGEADGGNSYTIWPHEWTLTESDYSNTLRLDGVTIDTYAMANELSRSGINGIGTICHEFSHCLGLPDFYDAIYSKNYGMGAWSIMASGNYNGNSFVPAGYTSYERFACGWLSLQELNATTKIKSMKPVSQSPEAYCIYNEGYPDEFFILENRQKEGWDASLPGKGLLVIHIDYDRSIWQNNIINSIVSASDAKYYELPTNDHQRCTIIRASNQTSSNGSGDAYPFGSVNALTNTSTPAATLYHYNTDNKKLMNIQLLNITQNTDGTMSFHFYDTAEQGPVVGIDETNANSNHHNGECYDLEGRRYDSSRQSLPHGVYIIKGKKIVL